MEDIEKIDNIEDRTGIEDYYAVKNGKKLRFGYTTGTCAAAATKAAATALVTGKMPERVEIMTPKGILLSLKVLEPKMEKDKVSCAIKKFSGDDPDATAGVMVYSEVSWSREPGITVDGGLGVGRVTKPGLKQKVGEPAINPVPMEMIKRAAEEALSDGSGAEGLKVVISIPEGVEIAKKTFNPRLGIEGGISVLGTSGIVEPMSEKALLDTIEIEIKQKHANGYDRLVMCPGNYGADFIREQCGVKDEQLVKCSNYLGQGLDMASAEGIKELLFVGNIGKFIKLTGGIMNSHSREADGRAELMAACAIRAGCDIETARTILSCLTTDEMLAAIKEAGLLEETMKIVAEKIDFYVNNRTRSEMKISVVVFSSVYGILCTTGDALKWMEELKSGQKLLPDAGV